MIAIMAAARERKGKANGKVDGRVCCLDWENQIHGREMAIQEGRDVAIVQIHDRDLKD